MDLDLDSEDQLLGCAAFFWDGRNVLSSLDGGRKFLRRDTDGRKTIFVAVRRVKERECKCRSLQVGTMLSCSSSSSSPADCAIGEEEEEEEEDQKDFTAHPC